MKNIPIRHIPGTKQEPGIEDSFIIRDSKELLAGKDMVQELHRHDFYFVLVLKKAKGKHVIDFQSYKVKGHTVFCMRPGQVHELLLKAGSTGYLLQFKKAFLSSDEHSLRKATNPNFYQLDTRSFKKIAILLESVLQEYKHKQEGYHEVIKANLKVLFIELNRQQSHAASNNTDQYTQERLDAFVSLVEKNITTHKQPSQYANLLHLSLHQLNTVTKTMLGKTASAFINEHIVLESKRWLLATAAQVKEIADQLGYEDPSYFIRFFKKHTGYSPDTFRQNFK